MRTQDGRGTKPDHPRPVTTSSEAASHAILASFMAQLEAIEQLKAEIKDIKRRLEILEGAFF